MRPLVRLALFLTLASTAGLASAQETPAHSEHYQRARELARAGELKKSGEALLDAITDGFSDFHRMRRDPALAPIRDTKVYETILLGWRDLLDARGQTDAASAKEALGKAYRIVRNEELRIHIVHAHRPEAIEDALDDLRHVARWWEEEVLAALPEQKRHPSPDRPHPWVTIVLPTPEDFVRLLGAGGVGGIYQPSTNRLISQDLGPSLRHEFVHALDWRLLRRMGARRPGWMLEAVASLVEDINLDETGALAPTPSWRTNIAKRREDLGRRMEWSRLFSLPRERFMGVRPNAQYAQARAIALYTWEREAFGEWVVRALREDADAALASALGATLEKAEREFARWLAALPEAPEKIEPGDASLGVITARGRGDGVRIERILPGSPAREAGLRMNDVLVRVGGLRVWTREDLARVLAERSPGEEVEIEARRYARRLHTTVTLEEAR